MPCARYDDPPEEMGPAAEVVIRSTAASMPTTPPACRPPFVRELRDPLLPYGKSHGHYNSARNLKLWVPSLGDGFHFRRN